MVRMRSKRTWGIILAILVFLPLALTFTFIQCRQLVLEALWMVPYDESHPASILATIENNSVVRLPKNMESFKAADRTDRGIDYAFYIFILRFKTDRDGLAQLRKSLSAMNRYWEGEVDSLQDPDVISTWRLRSEVKDGQVRTPEWYRELPEGEVWTAEGEGVRHGSHGEQKDCKFYEISCTWVFLDESEEVVVYMEGTGEYSLKDYGR